MSYKKRKIEFEKILASKLYEISTKFAKGNRNLRRIERKLSKAKSKKETNVYFLHKQKTERNIKALKLKFLKVLDDTGDAHYSGFYNNAQNLQSLIIIDHIEEEL